MTFEYFLHKFHIQLNNQQLAAIKSVEQATLLLAVPGSGKTTVLVTRLGYMIHVCGIQPEHILTVTYTVAATRDMKQRFARIFGEELANRLEFRTINGICAKIISYYGNCVGKKAFELAKDEGHRTRLLSAIYLKAQNEYPVESDLKNLSTQITYIKNRMLSKAEIETLGKELELPLYEIYTEYCSQMRQQALMDYDDQMVYALMMLQKSPELLAYFQSIYQYICVDEAQDTSKIQHEIIAILAGKQDKLFMVGDEDQSIYGFRAAYPEALLAFEKNHAEAKVLLMEENFRSTARIVFAADQFIQKNEFRHKKHMTTAREAGAEIQCIETGSRRAQYNYLVKLAKDCKTQTAVLYRDNESILPVVNLLEKNKIPYRIKNADLTFFSNRVVLDLQNIIRFAYNPMDTEVFEQIYYKIGTYMSKSAALEACRNSREGGIPVLEAALRYGKIAAGTQKSVKSMETHLKGLVEETAEKAIYRIVHFMGYGDYLERSHMKDSKVQIIEAIAANEPTPIRLLERLEELAQLMREKTFEQESNFILSTIHSSKGLEYDKVYLLDVKDGIFPETVITDRKHASDEELKLYEEERRLFYVGVTRAKNQLCIFDFKSRNTFCRELLGQKAQQAVQKQQDRGRNPMPKKTRNSSLYNGSILQKKLAKHIVTESEYYDKLEEIRSTGYVKHKSYGKGKIISVNGDTLEIAFESKTAKCKLKFMMENGLID